MHAAHIVTASHISILCKFAFDSLLYQVLLCIVGVPMKMDCLISMSNIERNVVVAQYNATVCAILKLYAYIVVVLYSCEGIFNFRIVEKTVVVTLDKNDLTIKTSDEIFRIIVECLPDHIAKYVNQIALANFLVSSADKLHIHFFHRSKRTVVKFDHIRMTEMQV